MKRRHFLQATSSMMGEVYLAQANRYGQALAQSSSRKLAFLVGINRYLETSDRSLTPLDGCETDVELQRQLLFIASDSSRQTLMERQSNLGYASLCIRHRISESNAASRESLP